VPLWSPDGSRIALVSADEECTPLTPAFEHPGKRWLRLKFVDVNGHSSVDVPALGASDKPSSAHDEFLSAEWSADGAPFVYLIGRWLRTEECRFDAERMLLLAVGANGQGEHRLPLDARVYLLGPWSPDGSRVVAAGYDGWHLLRPKGGRSELIPEELRQGEVYETALAWPANATIWVSHPGASQQGLIETINTATRGRKVVVKNNGAYRLEISRSGDRILAFTYNHRFLLFTADGKRLGSFPQPKSVGEPDVYLPG